MKELSLIRERIGIPPDFLTTVTCNTFRPEYYFDKADVVEKAVSVHRSFVGRDPQGYKESVEKALPIMLDVHKVLSAIYLWDNGLATDQELVSILMNTRPDHIADFWISIKEHRKTLGLKHKTLSSSARKLVWKLLQSIAEFRRNGKRQIALWMMKNKKTWNKALYYTHTKFEDPDLEWLAATFAFGRAQEGLPENEDVQLLLEDLKNIQTLVTEKRLTIDDIKKSHLPYRMIEGYASGQLDTTTKKWYWAVLDKMTNYEVLRRTDAMRRSGFLDEFPDLYQKRILRASRWIDPVAIASVIIQHPELRRMLDPALGGALESLNIELPKNSVVLCDCSRSMKLKRTRPQPRVLWELVGFVSATQGVPTFLFSDKVIPYPEGVGIGLKDGSARGPTSVSRALLKAKELSPEWIFLISDMQQNIPFRGHEKQVAKKIDATIVTLNPTVNPLEPEAATRLETENEIFLPISGLRQFEQIVEVLKE